MGRLTCDLDAVIVLEEALEGRKSHGWLIRSRHASSTRLLWIESGKWERESSSSTCCSFLVHVLPVELLQGPELELFRMAKSSGDTLALTDYFHSPNKAKKRQSASSSANSQPPPPPLKRTKLANPTKGTNRKVQASGQKEENLGQVTLSDSDDDDPKDPAREARDSGDDLVIIEPTPSTSKVKLESDSHRPPPPPPEKIASIFAPRRRPSASTSPQKSVASTTTPVKAEVHSNLELDKKPDIKPSPSKSIAIFDTAAATSGSAANATSSSSTANKNLPLDTSLFSFHPLTDISFSPHARVPFNFFTDALVLISSTKSRLYIQLVLTNLLRTVIERDPASLVSIIYLCSNRIGPSYEPQTELGIGWRELRAQAG